MNPRGLLLCFASLCFACGGDDDTPTPTPVPDEMLLRIEWGSVDPEGVSWLSQVLLEGAEPIQVEAYGFEDGDSLTKETLHIYSWTEGFLSDGLLLEVAAVPGATLTFLPGFGLEMPTFDLDNLELDASQYYPLEENTYVDVARIRSEEWDTGLSYNRYQSTRTDTLPRAPYEANALRYRYDSQESQAQIAEDARLKYEADTFFANAEDLRRAVNQQLYVTTSSVLVQGESFDVTVAAFDLYGHLVTDFAESVWFDVDGSSVTVPDKLEFQDGRDSLATAVDAGLALSPGYALITATDPTGRFAPGAIPVRVLESPGDRVFWGDLHTHSRLSDGDFGDIGPEDVYQFGRDVGRLDFMALTDHDYRRPVPDWKWPLQQEVVRTFNEPGRFVTFLAYEWSAEDMRYADVISHKNVFFRTDDSPVYSAWDPRFNTPEKLWAALREDPGIGNVLTIPHHPVRKIEVTEENPQYGGPGTDWRFHDEELQPLVEVYSRWGSSESDDPDNPRPVKYARDTGSAQYALGLGYRLGFIASSDTHDGTPGVSVLPARLSINVYPVGMVAVLAPELTREGVFDALYERRCYGVSGGRRILMSFRTTSGLQTGEVGMMEGSPVFEIEVAGTTRLWETALVRVDSGGERVEWSSESEGWFLEAKVETTPVVEEAAFYVRVTQEDNEMGWIGPIFLLEADPESASSAAAQP